MTGRETVRPKPKVTTGCSGGDAPAGTFDPFRTSIRGTQKVVRGYTFVQTDDAAGIVPGTFFGARHEGMGSEL